MRGQTPDIGVADTLGPAYESPVLTVLGTVQELTQWCFFGKNLGDPDYFDCIPIANCSS